MYDRDTVLYLMQVALDTGKVLHAANGLTNSEKRLVECEIHAYATVVNDLEAYQLERRLLAELAQLKTLRVA